MMSQNPAQARLARARMSNTDRFMDTGWVVVGGMGKPPTCPDSDKQGVCAVALNLAELSVVLGLQREVGAAEGGDSVLASPLLRDLHKFLDDGEQGCILLRLLASGFLRRLPLNEAEVFQNLGNAAAIHASSNQLLGEIGECGFLRDTRIGDDVADAGGDGVAEDAQALLAQVVAFDVFDEVVGSGEDFVGAGGGGDDVAHWIGSFYFGLICIRWNFRTCGGSRFTTARWMLEAELLSEFGQQREIFLSEGTRATTPEPCNRSPLRAMSSICRALLCRCHAP